MSILVPYIFSPDLRNISWNESSFLERIFNERLVSKLGEDKNEILWLRMFTTTAGTPHISEDEFIASDSWESVIPHHVCWITWKGEHFSWESIEDIQAAGRVFERFQLTVQESMNLLTFSYPNTEDAKFITWIAVGYDDRRKGAQSVESVHLHNVITPTGKGRKYKNMHPGVNGYQVFKNQTRKARVAFTILGNSQHVIKDLLMQAFKWVANITVAHDRERLFEKISFVWDCAEGIEISSILTSIWQFYLLLKEPWNQFRTRKNLWEELFTATIWDKTTRRIWVILQDHIPNVPTFNVVLNWNENYTRITKFSIVISPMWPAERINDAIILRQLES